MTEPAATVGAVREFNRFYTRHLGVLHERLLASPFSLTEARVLYELAQRERTTATQLGEDLRLDGGYLSRILGGFHDQGLVLRERSEADGRQTWLSLTELGKDAFARLNTASDQEVSAMLAGLSAGGQERLAQALCTVRELLADCTIVHNEPYLLRPPRSGDWGWVVQQHGLLYSKEYGWNAQFEALVAEIVAHVIRNFDPVRERGWIAEREGKNVGSVFLVRHPGEEGVAKLRLLLVEHQARGLGIGKRLVRECTIFAREAGYRRITLWTNSILVGARRIYEQEGYQLVQEEPHHSFGHALIGQTWELAL